MTITRRCCVCDEVKNLEVDDVKLDNPRRFTAKEYNFIKKDICPECSLMVYQTKKEIEKEMAKC